MNPLKTLLDEGQSLWLDYIRASLLESGELQRMISEDGLRGMTSNPTIFQKAITQGDNYDGRLRKLLQDNPNAGEAELFEKLAVQDIGRACDILRPVYDDSNGADGFVSIEVSPLLARDTEGTVQEARRLWREVDHPNVMIKVPATPEGIPAIETLIGEDIHVNVTLMFSLKHYEAVAHAYLRGLEKASRPAQAASVASFFVSRVDTKIDEMLDSVGTEEAASLKGRVAVANAKIAYRRFQQLFHGEAFKKFREEGVHVQRPLWASTSTKNPAYSDVLYVEELIGPDTVNTMPPETIDAFRDHGKVSRTVTEGVDEAKAVLDKLARLGIDLDKATEALQEEGVDKFAKSYDDLLEAIKKKRLAFVPEVNTPEPGNIVDHPAFREAAVENRLSQWERDRFGERLWNKDFTLWSKEHVPEITDRLGWLELPQSMPERTDEILALADSLKKDGIKKVVLLGMGGSSLAPDVFSKTFEPEGGAPALSVLDSTHPDAVKGMDESIDPAKTFFVVSSKSGTTLETLSLFRYFWSRVKGVSETPGRHFAAVSDPGTPLADLARERGFRKIFAANPEVGGRYSALTHFGLVPAGLMGVDIRAVLESGRTMAAACGPEVAAGDNPGLRLGAALGEFALQGRDKVTFLASPALSAIPIWMEQLIAESTGKTGKGIVPVADEPLGDVEAYGPDRFFAAFFLKGDGAPELESRLNALEEAGHPVARFALESKTDLGGIFFLWETAVAAAGAVLGIQPFNQPDVQLAKELAKKAMSGEGGGSESDVETVAASSNGFGGRLKAWMDLARGGDYAALQAYLAPDEHVWKALQEIRTALRARLGTAVTVGYGPRFLHSTGQLHKGGPNTGLFLQIVDRPDDAVPVPETDFNFRDLIHAQTVGDYRAMKQRDRRVIRVDLGKDPGGGLKRILEAVLD